MLDEIYEGSGWRFVSTFVISGSLECKIGAHCNCIIGMREHFVAFNIKKLFFCLA